MRNKLTLCGIKLYNSRKSTNGVYSVNLDRVNRMIIIYKDSKLIIETNNQVPNLRNAIIVPSLSHENTFYISSHGRIIEYTIDTTKDSLNSKMIDVPNSLVDRDYKAIEIFEEGNSILAIFIHQYGYCNSCKIWRSNNMNFNKNYEYDPNLM